MVLQLTKSHQWGHSSQNWQALHAEVAQLEANLLLFLQKLRCLCVVLPHGPVKATLRFNRRSLLALGAMETFALEQYHDESTKPFRCDFYAVSSAF